VPHPGWSKLSDVLTELVDACGGTFAAVVDEGNGLWSVARGKRSAATGAALRPEEAADRFYREEIAPRAMAMRRGGRLDLVRSEGEAHYVAESFASIYVLVVWFEGPFEAPLVRARLRHALPSIEALILALPPPSGPEVDAGARKVRA
jgi:hypothetical protein